MDKIFAFRLGYWDQSALCNTNCETWKKFNPNPIATKNKIIKSATNFVHFNFPSKCNFIHSP